MVKPTETSGNSDSSVEQKVIAWRRAGSLVMRDGLREHPSDGQRSPTHVDHPGDDTDVVGEYRTIKNVIGSLYIDYMDLQIKKKLGEGAFAQVYHGILMTDEVPKPGKDVAVKMLKHEHLKTMSEVFMFFKEFKTLKHLHHPNIVQLIGIGGVQNAEGKVVEMFIVQELCRGGTLRHLVQDQMITVFKKQYSMYDAVRWSFQIASALNYLHRCDPIVIHRDLKLENIILTDYPQKLIKSSWRKTSGDPPVVDAKLADFGLATLLATPQRQLHNTFSGYMRRSSDDTKPKHIRKLNSNKVISMLERMKSLSSFGSLSGESLSSGPVEMTGVAGSYGYMAPEVFRDEQYNEKVDIFSFGVLMYNLCYRVIPALMIMSNGETEDMVEYAKRVADGFRQPLNDDKVPAEINSIIRDCWSQNPVDRPSANKVVERLREFLASGTLDTTEISSGCSTCCSVM